MTRVALRPYGCRETQGLRRLTESMARTKWWERLPTLQVSEASSIREEASVRSHFPEFSILRRWRSTILERLWASSTATAEDAAKDSYSRAERIRKLTCPGLWNL